MKGLRGTALTTAMFVVVSAATWWVWLGWKSGVASIRDVVIVTPIVWWALVARTGSVRPGRAALAGALIGLVTGVAPLLQEIWSNRGGLQDGLAGLRTHIAVGLYGTATLVGIPIGAGVGLLAALIQRPQHASPGRVVSAQ